MTFSVVQLDDKYARFLSFLSLTPVGKSESFSLSRIIFNVKYLKMAAAAAATLGFQEICTIQ